VAYVLVIDLGSTGVRAMLIAGDASMVGGHYVESPPRIPAPGLVEYDATRLLEDAETAVVGALAASGVAANEVAAIGLTVQRATTVVWDATTSRPVGPALSWQDLRTLGDCLVAVAQGHRMPPNASGTKAQHLVRAAREAGIEEDRLRFGTLDTWLVWNWSGSELHVTDPTNAGVTAMVDVGARTWSEDVLEVLGLPMTAMPSIVATAGICGEVSLAGVTAPLSCLVGDQQSSLVGQGGIRTGVVKATFGTACMVDVNTGPQAPVDEARSTYPIVVVQTSDRTDYGREATVISAGDAVRGIVALGMAASPAEVSTLAAEVGSSGGVQYVPALLGLGTPYWDYGARGALMGLSLASDRRHVARAVLDGIAARAAECVRELESDAALAVDALRVDGGAAASEVLCQATADRLGIPVRRSSEREATALGCGLLAALGAGLLTEEDLASIPSADRTFEPVWDQTRRNEAEAEWKRAVAASRGWIEGLSAISF